MTSARRYSLRTHLCEWGWFAAGFTLFLVSLPLYESWASRQVLERWSYGYFLFFLSCVAAWLLFLIVTGRRSLDSESAHTADAGWRRLFGIAVFLWGLSYFFAALDSNANAARILQPNLVGSTFPPSVLLDWLAIAVLGVALGMLVARKLPKRWHNPALMVGTVAVILLLGEGITRVWVVAAPEPQGLPTYSGALWVRRYVVLNSAGYRDVEHALNKANGIRRVMIVGDSHTYAVGIADTADRFGEQLAARLGAKSEERWEAINAGQPDTHTLQHIASLEQMIGYNPDLIVLLYSFNDVDYLAPLTPRPGLLRKDRIRERLHPVRVLFLNFYLFQDLYARWRKIALVVADKQPSPDPYAAEALMDRHFGDLQSFVRVGRSAGAAVLIVPFENQVGTSATQQARYERFVREAEAYGLPVCGIAGAFANRDPGELRVNSLDGHGNALAHHLAAEAALRCVLGKVDGAQGSRQWGA